MERYNEEELIYLIRCGYDEANQCLFDMYDHSIRAWLMPFRYYYHIGYDMDDIIQLGMIHFWDAITSYRDDYLTSFYSYAKTIVTRRVYSEIVLSRKKQTMKDQTMISFDDYLRDDDGFRYSDVIGDSYVPRQPQKIFTIKEQTAYYLTDVLDRTTPLEEKTLLCYLQGYSEKEIAIQLHVSIKSVYNALYRAHHKVSH